eukprot:CAMPEP_0116151936 /NCGR_PEP_ID=MMETSP0329-20121206/20377_1 /TAXON_ID=697910 /ORGANISM="Pseudo-nitzschia arenysensis, Strain B593" /LENGTH=559 /DNA_ID=CAMNT_0003648611 /DNA_START=42 /DNA_END=1721 /DNA_ORIENTATION=-
MSDLNEKKREEMKRVVIDALTEEFKKPGAQSFGDISAFVKGLEAGREMELIILTGGLCNFSYRLHFKDSDKDDDVCMFVKLTFGTPILFPDTPCSPDRTNYEFKMMEMYAEASPYPKSKVKPYLCFDVEGSEENMKVIVTEFSRLEEQAGNLFVDGGVVDKVYSTKIAKSIAALHNTEVKEPDFNEKMKEFFMSLTGLCQMFFEGYLDESNENPDRTALRAREIGEEALSEIMDAYCKMLMRTDCYVHGDCHVFNMLVESTLKALQNEDESSFGDVAIVDWEFSHYGPMGKDLGWAQCFPLACVLAHSINGDAVIAESIVAFCENLWDEYYASIDLEGKDLTAVDLYRQTVAFCGIMLSGYSGLGVHMEYLPVEEGNEEDLTKVKDALGVLALEFFEIGFRGKPEGASLEDLRKLVKDAIQKEMDFLSPKAPKPAGRRRSSLLRSKNRRVSDAHVFFSMAADVSSIAESAILESCEFSANTSGEMMATYFGTRDEDEFKLSSPSTSRSRTSTASRASRISRRSHRISVMPRISLAITDLKRKSVCKWDNLMADFESFEF